MEELIAELIATGLELHYLRGSGSHWEALVRRRTQNTEHRTIHYTVGFGSGHSPLTALVWAINRLQSNPTETTEPLADPTCDCAIQPAPDLSAILGNLLPAKRGPRFTINKGK